MREETRYFIVDPDKVENEIETDTDAARREPFANLEGINVDELTSGHFSEVSMVSTERN